MPGAGRFFGVLLGALGYQKTGHLALGPDMNCVTEIGRVIERTALDADRGETRALMPDARAALRAKLAIEEEAIKFGAWVIRPGTIYGGSGGGLFAGLRSMATKLPFIPLIDGGRQQLFLVHIDDLCEAMLKIAFDDSLTAAIEPLSLAASRPLELREILGQLAQQAGKKSRFLYVPSLFVLPAMKLAESIGIKLPFRRDSLVSIRNMNPNASVESKFLGIKLREYVQSN